MNKVHRNMAVYLARNLEFSNRRLTKKDRNRVAQVAYNLVSYGYGFKTSCGSFTSLHRWIKQLNSTIGEGHKLNPLNWNHSGSVSSIKNMEENYDGYICELYCDCLDSGRRAISVSPSTNPARRTRCNSLWWVRHLCRPYMFFERERESATLQLCLPVSRMHPLPAPKCREWIYTCEGCWSIRKDTNLIFLGTL